MRFKLLILFSASFILGSAHTITLDSCRNMALKNNKDIHIAEEKVRQSVYHNKEARAGYLPSLDFAGSYIYNQKELSIFDSDQLLPTKTFNPSTGQYDFNLVMNPETGMPLQLPDGSYVPSTVALIPKEAMTYDIHNVFAGAITLTQPLYMGGKIVAMNNITKYAEQLAKDLRDNTAQDIIYNVDAAYWMVVSLRAKKDLASSYVGLLDSLHKNVQLMFDEGIATKADVLSVAVKLNSANVDLMKVENGLVLSRMNLNQICGLPINEAYFLEDEGKSQDITFFVSRDYNMNDVYAQRKDVRALETAVKIFEQRQKVAMSSMMPNIALIGSYSFSNPNMFNGFKKEFAGSFSVGAMITIPIWHWGGNYNKYRASKSGTVIQQLELNKAKEKIELQVSQATFKAQEAVKTYTTTKINMEKAEENLRQAELGFEEGMITADNVMEAQTAWLKASSEVIDAMIDVKLCNVYLSKVLGILNY